MVWKVTETRIVAKQLIKLPKMIKLIYAELVDDLVREGCFPKGWDVIHLKGGSEEYRAIFKVIAPKIIVLKVVHRKEAYR